jgi:hypothetical protein
MSGSSESSPRVVDLPSAGVPADHGMASLGLVMQLAGRTSGALAALIASLIVLEARGHRHAGWLFVAVALCIARSQLHRIAGRDLVYGRRTIDGDVADPFEAMRRYVAFGLGHAIAIGLIATGELGATARTAAGITAALALWPIALAVVLARFRSLRAGIPLGEDRGLESASLVMTMLGACGVLAIGAMLIALQVLPNRDLQHGWGPLFLFAFGLLLVRSYWHLRAGVAGLRDASFDRPGELTSVYVRLGVFSAFLVGGVLALLAMAEQLAPAAIASVLVVTWLLTIWPLTIKRFINHRQFAELLAGDRVIHRRAPDGGLTGLGWLLAGHAACVAAVLVLELTVEPRGVGRPLGNLLALTGPALGPLDGPALDALGRWLGHELGASLGPSLLGLVGSGVAATVVVLELLTAGALLGMTRHRRTLATIFALVASVIAVAAAWSVLRSGGHRFDLRTVLRLIPLAIQIVVPAATLVLVRRSLVPGAQARYRR